MKMEKFKPATKEKGKKNDLRKSVVWISEIRNWNLYQSWKPIVEFLEIIFQRSTQNYGEPHRFVKTWRIPEICRSAGNCVKISRDLWKTYCKGLQRTAQRSAEICEKLQGFTKICGKQQRTVENCGELWRSVENCGDLYRSPQISTDFHRSRQISTVLHTDCCTSVQISTVLHRSLQFSTVLCRSL